MKRMMKIMFTFLLVFVSVITLGSVKADVVLDKNFEINIENTNIVQEYDTKASRDNLNSYINLSVKSNNEDFDHLSSFGVARLGNYYYSINDSEYKIVSKDDADSSSIKIYYEDIKDILAKTNELKFKVYFESVDKTIRTKESTVNLLVIEKNITLKDEKTGIILVDKFVLPYGSKIEVEEVTDQTILNSIKFSNPTVWKIKLSAYGKNINYYDDKYGFDDKTNQGLIFGVSITIPVPKKNNYSAELDVLGQFVSSDFKSIETVVDMGIGTDYSSYEVSVHDGKYLSDNYYFVLSDTINFFDEDQDWEKFVTSVKNNKLIKEYYKSTITHDDSKMVITTVIDNVTYTTQFDYSDGIVSYESDEKKDNEALLVDSYMQAIVMQEWLEKFGFDIEDSELEKFMNSKTFTLSKDGIEFKEENVTIKDTNGKLTFTYMESLKFDLRKGLMTYKKTSAESKTENNSQNEETVENPKTGIVIGTTSLGALLIAGLVMKKKNKFNRV